MSVLLLMSAPQTLFSYEYCSQAAWPVQNNAVVLSHRVMLMSEFNHSFRPFTKHMMKFLKWAVIIALEEAWKLNTTQLK